MLPGNATSSASTCDEDGLPSNPVHESPPRTPFAGSVMAGVGSAFFGMDVDTRALIAVSPRWGVDDRA